jgi:thiamine pyrophosphokinase
MNKKTITIVANGDIGWLKKKDLKDFSYIIGVDRAAYLLLNLGIIPDCAVGDFDSVSKRELKEIKRRIKDVREYPADKDKTDLELAMEVAFEQNPLEIVIYGVTGRRLDHEIAAFQLLYEIQKRHCKAILRDRHNEIRIVEKECRIEKKNHFSYLSILPFSEEITISIAGCKYPLDKHVMKKGTTLGVSNIIISDFADITIHTGIAYCILSKDGQI